MSIEVTNVSKLYGTQKALDDVSFKVKKGEIVGFLGPNGAGKSTMMKIISCFLPQSSGSVKVCGHDVQNDSMKVRSLVGYLPESNPLYYDMYIKEYLEFVCGIYALPNPKQRVEKMIAVTGLELEQHKHIGQLSKGYKQRVGIAQALIHDPQVLILDEPTSGLDPNQLIGIRSLIKELGKEKTVLFSSHIMQEVEAVSNRIIIINKGKLVADQKVGSVSSLKKQIVLVEFDGEIDVIKFENILSVDAITKLNDGKYQFIGKQDADLRRDVSRKAQELDLLVLGMTVIDQKLEDVFQELTSKR
ncbi:MAG: gliding motility-associated ABC transporter ATP-binding subunit GldA [Flavobacteriales bacterium]|nr:gliding motility-associated ABC transporter ATP-binding subunit GldA [Flavobacteriales bacterium]